MFQLKFACGTDTVCNGLCRFAMVNVTKKRLELQFPNSTLTLDCWSLEVVPKGTVMLPKFKNEHDNNLNTSQDHECTSQSWLKRLKAAETLNLMLEKPPRSCLLYYAVHIYGQRNQGYTTFCKSGFLGKIAIVSGFFRCLSEKGRAKCSDFLLICHRRRHKEEWWTCCRRSLRKCCW